MTFANPFAWALLGLLVVPIILYLLPMPRRRADQPSLILWKRMLQSRPASQSWRWLRTLASFLLQAGILVLLVFAVGKPVFSPSEGEGDTVVVVVDASASMKAPVSAASTETRFDRARALARGLVASLPSGRRAAIVAAESVPRVVAGLTDERPGVLRRIEAMGVTDRPGDVAAAVRAALALAGGEPGAEVCLISDGGADLSGVTLGKVTLRWLRVGGNIPNVGIVACRARRAFENPGEFEALARVRNASPEPRTVTLRVAMDDNVIDTRTLNLAPGAEAAETLTGKVLGWGRLKLSIEPGDVFPGDDVATANLGSAVNTQVVFVSDVPDRFLLSALTANRGIDSYLRSLSQYQEMAASLRPDVFVFGGALPAELPAGNLFIINPPNVTSLFQFSADLAGPKLVDWRRDHPVFADVTLKDVYIPAARALKASADAEVLMQSDGGPLMLAYSTPARRVIVMGFDPGITSLSFRVAFPVLMANAFAWLTRGGPGAPAAADANLVDARESDLVVPAKLVFADAAVAGRDGRAGGLGEFWFLAAAGALALVAVEWVLYHHRVTV